MNCKRQHADSNVKAHVRGSSPKCLMIHEAGAGISIAVQEIVNPEYKSIQTAIIQCVHINHTMHTMFTGPSYYFWPFQSPFSKSQGLLDILKNVYQHSSVRTNPILLGTRQLKSIAAPSPFCIQTMAAYSQNLRPRRPQKPRLCEK